MRRASMSVLAGFLLAVLVVAALPSVAANGDPILMGEKNTAKRITKVRTKGGVAFESLAAGTPAATFNVVSGAPIAVNSDTLVSKLNAEKVGGRQSYQLFVNFDNASNEDLPDATGWTSDIVVLVPLGGGAVTMSGGFGWHNNTGTAHSGACVFKVDGVDVPGSFRASTAANGESESCNSDALKRLPAGTYTITFASFGMAYTGVKMNEMSWYVLVLPN